jgi:hypothetical protein
MKSTGILLGIVLALAGPLVAAEPVSVVVLPPAVAEGATAQQVAATELWCDQLAAAMGEIDGVSVVDRTAISKVLAERKLGRKNQPVLSFDAMIRVQEGRQANRPNRPGFTVTYVPFLVVTLVDLSTGNVLYLRNVSGQHVKGEASISKAMVDALTERLHSDAKQTKKVRIVGLVDTPTRMTPLGNQMVLLFGEALKKNPAIELVQHLEATTAAEESLLLYMGLSKLPGGRTFSPQSDVTMEFRVTETDAIGKTFEETGIELGLRWQPAGNPPS